MNYLKFFRNSALILLFISCFNAFGQAKILVIVAHPNLAKSEVNQKFLQEISADKNITIHDLYKTYPDEKLNIAEEEKLILANDIIVFQFPMQWFSAPSLLKKWQDEVVTGKFVFGASNRVKGKKLLIAISAGGTSDDFHHGGSMHATIDEILAPYEAFAGLCQMTYLIPFVSYGVPNPQILNIPMTTEDKKIRQAYIDTQSKTYYEYLKKLILEK